MLPAISLAMAMTLSSGMGVLLPAGPAELVPAGAATLLAQQRPANGRQLLFENRARSLQNRGDIRSRQREQTGDQRARELKIQKVQKSLKETQRLRQQKQAVREEILRQRILRTQKNN